MFRVLAFYKVKDNIVAELNLVGSCVFAWPFVERQLSVRACVCCLCLCVSSQWRHGAFFGLLISLKVCPSSSSGVVA